MNWFVYLALYFLGWFVCSFSMGNILLLLFFSIPFTNKLDKNGIVTNKKAIIQTNIIGIIVQLIIFLLISFAIYHFVNEYFIGYCVGMVIPFFSILAQCKPTPNNIEDYLKSFGRFINIEKLEEYLNNN